VLSLTAADGSDRRVDGRFENVLCPIDFSEVSTAALEHALRVVDEPRGRLTLVHVLPNLDPMSRYAYEVTGPYYEPLVERNAMERLHELLPSDVRAGINVHTRVVSGPPAEQIARVSRDIDADLIVIGVTARGAIGRQLFGSTAVRVMRSAGRPILAIPERMHRAATVSADLDAESTIAA
jgi:universal stress protein A